MADVTLTYKGQSILELSESGNKTIKTAGKYCEDDISLAYIKSEGGDGSGYNILKGRSSPIAGIGQDGDVYLQYSGNQNSIVASFVKVNGTWQALVGSDVDDVTDSGMYTDTKFSPPSSLGSDGDYYYQRDNWQRSFQSVNASATIEGSNTLAYGIEFTVTEPLTVKSLFVMTKENRTGKLQIGTTSEILAETESVTFPANEWTEVQLQSPIQLTTGTNYVVKAAVDTTYSYGRIAYVWHSPESVTYDSRFSYVRARYGTTWPGTSETPNRVFVGVTFMDSDGLFRIHKQFYKTSGSWSEIT